MSDADFHAENLEFLDCARYGEREEIQAQLDNKSRLPVLSFKDISKNYQNAFGASAAHMAAANNHIGVLIILMRSGFDVSPSSRLLRCFYSY